MNMRFLLGDGNALKLYSCDDFKTLWINQKILSHTLLKGEFYDTCFIS